MDPPWTPQGPDPLDFDFSLFSAPDSNPLNDNNGQWVPPNPSEQHRIGISPNPRTPKMYPLKPFLQPQDGPLDDICCAEGSGGVIYPCYCSRCFEKGVERDVRSEFEASIETLRPTTIALAGNSSHAPLDNADENRYSVSWDMIPSRSAQDISNTLPPLIVPSIEWPRKRRRGTAEGSIAPVPNPDENSSMLEMLDIALCLDPESDDFKEKILTLRGLRGIQLKSGVSSVPSPPTMLRPSPRVQTWSKPLSHSAKSSSFAKYQSRTAGSISAEPLSQKRFVSSSRAMSEKMLHTRRNIPLIYHCTYKACMAGPWAVKSDWKRHEAVHWPNRYYICKECSSHKHPEGGFACSFCFSALPDVESVKIHVFRCGDARRAWNEFPRPDKLREHHRKDHALQVFQEEEHLSWFYSVDCDWPRQCGFCGLTLDNWDDRADHIESEFQQGAKISNWRIPFVPKSRDRNFEDSGHHTKDDDDDDDDDDDNDYDFHDSMGRGVKADFTPSGVASQPLERNLMPFGTGREYASNSRSHEMGNVLDESSQNGYSGSEVVTNSALHPKMAGVLEIFGFSFTSSTPKLESSHHDSLSRKEFVGESLTASLPKSQHPERSKMEVSLQSPISSNNSLRDSFCLFEHQTQMEKLELRNSPQIHHRELKQESSSTTEALSSNSLYRTKTTQKLPSLDYFEGNSLGRVQCLFLDIEEPHLPMVITSTKIPIKPAQKVPSPALKTARSFSSVSSVSSQSDHSFSSSPESSVSVATSISIPPWHPPAFRQAQALDIGPYVYGYDLPCEFFFIGCDLRFHPADFEAWISHSASHLGSFLPQTVVCTFCDKDEGVFHSKCGDTLSNWRDRMVHIGGHLENFAPLEKQRPDYWIIEHMIENGLISVEDYANTLEGTERPDCANLVSLDYKTPKQILEEQRRLQKPHDLNKENRVMRRQIQKCENVSKLKICRCQKCQLIGNCTQRLEERCYLDRPVSVSFGHHESAIDQTIPAKLAQYEEGTFKHGPDRLGARSHDTMDITTNPIPVSTNSQAYSPAKVSSGISSLPIVGSEKQFEFQPLELLSPKQLIPEEPHCSDSVSSEEPFLKTSISQLDGTIASCLLDSKTTTVLQSVITQELAIRSREPSTACRPSHSSTTESYYHTSSRSNIGSLSVGLYSRSRTRLAEEPKLEKYRVPDSDRKYIQAMSRGDVVVINHGCGIYDPEVPRSSAATSTHSQKERRHLPSRYKVPRKRQGLN